MRRRRVHLKITTPALPLGVLVHCTLGAFRVTSFIGFVGVFGYRPYELKGTSLFPSLWDNGSVCEGCISVMRVLNI